MKRFVVQNPSIGTYAPRKFNSNEMADKGQVRLHVVNYIMG